MVMRLLLSSGIRGAARLVFALMRDRRVPLAAKLILPAAVVYVVLPIDILPDIIPVLGQIDDLVWWLSHWWCFSCRCPAGC